MTQSHWQSAAPSLALEATLPAGDVADVVVIGGGVVGASAAYWLARAGARVTLLERTSLAAGATGRNGGFLTVGAAEPYPDAIRHWGHATAKSIWQLTYDNRDLMREVIAAEEITCDYREPGCLHLALGEAALASLRAEAALLNADGFSHDVLDRRQVQDSAGITVNDEVVGALLLPRGGLLHSARLVIGLASAAQRYGARVLRAQVMHITRLSGIPRVLTDCGAMEARSVVVAANAWLGQLVPQLRGFIRPVRGQALSFRPIAPIFRHGFSAAVTETEEYWQQTPDGVIVLGGCRAIRPDRDEDTMSDGVTEDVQSALEDVLPRLFPPLSGELYAARRWSGPMAFTPDRLPVVDRVPDAPNVWFAGGFCGHGMPFGMMFGKLLAEAVMTSERPSALAPFGMRW